MKPIQVNNTEWRGVAAWTIATDRLEVTVTVVGAHLAALRVPGDDLNPLWQPPWPAGHPDEARRNQEIYGPEPDGPLLATIVGHNLCLDRFGAPWPGENKPTHGETPAVLWKLDRSTEQAAVFSCTLPEAGLDITRELSFSGETLRVTTGVSHAAGKAASIEWAEHVTVGDPFLANSEISAGIDAAWMSTLEPVSDWRFSGIRAEDPVDPTEALSMPTETDNTAVGDVVTARVTDGWFRVDRPDLRRRLEYSWDKDEFPWLCIWTQHRSRTGSPWNGVTRAKGLEFSTKPFPEGKPPASRSEEFHGRPTSCLLPPNQVLTRSFLIRWTEY